MDIDIKFLTMIMTVMMYSKNNFSYCYYDEI